MPDAGPLKGQANALMCSLRLGRQVMSEYVKHHVKQEQNEMSPKAQKTKLDMVALGERMAERKAELLAAGD